MGIMSIPLLGHEILETTGALDYLKSAAAWVAQTSIANAQVVPNAIAPATDRIPVAGPLFMYPAKLAGSLWATPAAALSAYDAFFDLGDVVSENPEASIGEKTDLLMQQAWSDVSPFVNGFASALLFEAPRAQIAQTWEQFKTDPLSVDYVALNHNVTTSSADSALAWAGLVPPLWEVSSTSVGLIETGLRSAARAGDAFAASTLGSLGDGLLQPAFAGASEQGGAFVGTLEGVRTMAATGAGTGVGLGVVGAMAMAAQKKHFLPSGKRSTSKNVAWERCSNNVSSELSQLTETDLLAKLDKRMKVLEDRKHYSKGLIPDDAALYKELLSRRLNTKAKELMDLIDDLKAQSRW